MATKQKRKPRKTIPFPSPGKIRRSNSETRQWQQRRIESGECPIHGMRLRRLWIQYYGSGHAEYVSRTGCDAPGCCVVALWESGSGVPRDVLEDPEPKQTALSIVEPWHLKGSRRMRRWKLSRVLWRKITA